MNTGLFPATLNKKKTIFVYQHELSVMAERLNRCTASTWNASAAQVLPAFNESEGMIVEQSVECELAGETEILGKNQPQYHLSTTNTT
jgi:hypothetical protein